MKLRTAIAVPCVSLLLVATAISTSDELIRAVFGRGDLLWIAILCAAAVAVWGVTGVRTGRGRAVVGVLSFSVTVWAIATIVGGEMNMLSGAAVASYHVALLGLSAAGLCLAMAVPSPRARPRPRRSTSGDDHAAALSLAVLIVLAILVPVAYGYSIGEASRNELIEALQSGRIVRARELAGVVRAVRPEASAMDIPLEELIPALAAEEQRLTARLELPLPPRPTSAEIGQRAVVLMQLDRNREALHLLEPLTADPARAPVALDYCGLCCQRLAEWAASRDWYEMSRRFWNDQPAGQRRDEALVSACKGIAFAERRMNHPLRAEQAYKDSLAVSNDAETHFLLALLHEEQQQTKLAEHHAHAAASLAPARYAEQSRELCDRMALSHFGCFQLTTRAASHGPAR